MQDMPKKPDNQIDAYAPPQIAAMVENTGVNKASLPVLQTLTLALLVAPVYWIVYLRKP